MVCKRPVVSHNMRVLCDYIFRDTRICRNVVCVYVSVRKYVFEIDSYLKRDKAVGKLTLEPETVNEKTKK